VLQRLDVRRRHLRDVRRQRAAVLHGRRVREPADLRRRRGGDLRVLPELRERGLRAGRRLRRGVRDRDMRDRASLRLGRLRV